MAPVPGKAVQTAAKGRAGIAWADGFRRFTIRHERRAGKGPPQRFAADPGFTGPQKKPSFEGE